MVIKALTKKSGKFPKGKRLYGDTLLQEENESDEDVTLKKKRKTEDTHECDDEVRTARSLALAYGKPKQLTAIAFHEDLIDRLPQVVDRETLAHSATLLDASVRIYSSRVDNTLNQVFEIRTNLGKQEPFTASNEAYFHTSNNSSPNRDGITIRSVEDPFDETTPHLTPETVATDGAEFIKKMQGACRTFYCNSGFDTPTFVSTNGFLEKQMKPIEFFLHGFQETKQKILDENCSRRKQLPLLCNCLDDLNSDCNPLAINPLFEKAARNLDEGSCRGLLLVNALTDVDASMVVIHNYAEVLLDDTVNTVETAELFFIYGSLLEAEKFSEVQKQAEHDEKLCVVEHEFCIATQQICRDDKNVDDCVGKLINFSAVTSEFLALLTWRMNFQKIYNLSAEDFFRHTTVALYNRNSTVWNWFYERLFVFKNMALHFVPSLCLSGEDGLYKAKLSRILDCFEKSFSWTLYIRSKESSPSNDSAPVFNGDIKGRLLTFFYAESVHNDKQKNVSTLQAAASCYSKSLEEKTIFTKNDLNFLISVIYDSGMRECIISRFAEWKKRKKKVCNKWNVIDNGACNIENQSHSDLPIKKLKKIGKKEDEIECRVRHEKRSIDDCKKAVDDSHCQVVITKSEQNEKVLDEYEQKGQTVVAKTDLEKLTAVELVKPLKNASKIPEAKSPFSQKMAIKKQLTVSSYTPLTTRDLMKKVIRETDQRDQILLLNSQKYGLESVISEKEVTAINNNVSSIYKGKESAKLDCDLELSLYHGTENDEPSLHGVEEEAIEGNEGIFARAFGLTHLAKQRLVNTPLIKKVIIAALSNRKWCAGVPENALSSSLLGGIELREIVTFSFLLARIRFELMGSIDNFTVTDVFSVLLQVCNENNLELRQPRDEQGVVVSLDDFIISRSDRSKYVEY